jgi:hypothetical protein
MRVVYLFASAHNLPLHAFLPFLLLAAVITDLDASTLPFQSDLYAYASGVAATLSFWNSNLATACSNRVTQLDSSTHKKKLFRLTAPVGQKIVVDTCAMGSALADGMMTVVTCNTGGGGCTCDLHDDDGCGLSSGSRINVDVAVGKEYFVIVYPWS